MIILTLVIYNETIVIQEEQNITLNLWNLQPKDLSPMKYSSTRR